MPYLILSIFRIFYLELCGWNTFVSLYIYIYIYIYQKGIVVLLRPQHVRAKICGMVIIKCYGQQFMLEMCNR